jgi:hypothetical protein
MVHSTLRATARHTAAANHKGRSAHGGAGAVRSRHSAHGRAPPNGRCLPRLRGGGASFPDQAATLIPRARDRSRPRDMQNPCSCAEPRPGRARGGSEPPPTAQLPATACRLYPPLVCCGLIHSRLTARVPHAARLPVPSARHASSPTEQERTARAGARSCVRVRDAPARSQVSGSGLAENCGPAPLRFLSGTDQGPPSTPPHSPRCTRASGWLGLLNPARSGSASP